MTDHTAHPTASPTANPKQFDDRLPRPSPSCKPGTLPSAVTFFLSRSQRAALLAALRSLNPDRTRALLTALGISDTPER